MKFTWILCLLITVFFSACYKKENKNWTVTIPDIISSSSPRAVDLNGDGILDIVMGAGNEEWKRTNKGVIALDGASGELLWTAESSNQMVGTPVFQDITNDNTPDVIIGGRSAELQALDGKSGKLIWQFFKGQNAFTARDSSWYNFYNPQFIPDQNADGIADLLICNGGDALIPAGMKYRPPGKLMVLNGKTGKILAQALMPDGQETYFSPLCLDCESNKNPTILFGSGGETRPGHLYLCQLSDLKSGNLKKAKILDSSTKKGYEAPPILADFNGDKTLDIFFNTAEGKTELLDGKTHKPIWAVKCDSAEVFSQPAIGYFTGNDQILDVFVNFAIGVYPFYHHTEQWLMDGKTGKVVQKFETQRFTYSSPLTTDFDGDGTDEVVMNMVKDSLKGTKQKPFYELSIFDFKNHKTGILATRQNGACFASTPWLGDLDNDGKLDVIYSGSPAIISEFPGNTSYEHPPLTLFVHRVTLDSLKSSAVKWGSYMGKDAKSIWR